PDLAVVRHAAANGVRILRPVRPASDVRIERLDVPGICQLADTGAADMEDVRHVAAGQAEKEFRVEAVVVDLLEVDLDVDPGELLLNCRGGLLDVLRLETRLIGVGDVDRAGDRAAGWRGQSGR